MDHPGTGTVHTTPATTLKVACACTPASRPKAEPRTPAAARPGSTDSTIDQRIPTAATRAMAVSGPNDRAEIVHGPLEAVGAAVDRGSDDVGQQGVTPLTVHAQAQNRATCHVELARWALTGRRWSCSR